MYTKKFLIVTLMVGIIVLEFNNSTQVAEIFTGNSEVQQLSHWTQFRDGFYKNVLGINRDKDNDRKERHNHHPPHRHHHHDYHR